jgi:Fumarylacetoacetate (FAA) hydrolase family
MVTTEPSEEIGFRLGCCGVLTSQPAINREEKLKRSSSASALQGATPSLVAGYVISTGTPEGVGCARKPPLWTKPSDVVEVEVGGIGILRNPLVAED